MKTLELSGALAAVGQTPLVRLDRVRFDQPVTVYAKLELLNPGGSMKDRPAKAILIDAIERGLVTPGRTVVVESSSGNFAVGLAQACRYFGIELICVVDPAATRQNIDTIRAYGARVERVTQPDPVAGNYLQARLHRVRELVSTLPDTFWPDQYSNPLVPSAHHGTVEEIIGALDGPPDYLYCAVSTCGLLRGFAEYVRLRNLPTRIIAVDAVGSVIFGGAPGERKLPGHGAAVRSALFQPDLAHEVVHVSDLESIAACRWLVRNEALLVGGSSGAVLAAVRRRATSMPPNSTCVLIMHDRGERYLDTIYSDQWVGDHFGVVPDGHG